MTHLIVFFQTCVLFFFILQETHCVLVNLKMNCRPIDFCGKRKIGEKQLLWWPKPTVGASKMIFLEVMHTILTRQWVGGYLKITRNYTNRLERKSKSPQSKNNAPCTGKKVSVRVQDSTHPCAKVVGECLRQHVRASEAKFARRTGWARPGKGQFRENYQVSIRLQ